MAEKTRYSDQELAEFKKLIEEKLESAKKEYYYYQQQLRLFSQTIKEGNFLNLEDGAETYEKEQLNQMAGRQSHFIQHLDNALVRIANHTYGICRVSGKLIGKDRLKAVPHATLSIDAKLSRK